MNYRAAYWRHLTKGDVEHRLSAAERVDFMGNAEALAQEAELPAADALSLVETLPQRSVRTGGAESSQLALAPREHLVPENLCPTTSGSC